LPVTTYMRALFLLILAAAAAVAQPIGFGVKGGVPMTDFVDTVQTGHFSYTPENHRYIVGASLELRLPAGFGIEFDALYRRFGYVGSGNLVDVITESRTTANAWEFPLLAKYRFPTRVIRPFVDAGIAWNTLQGLQQSVTNVVLPNRTSASSTSNPAELRHNTTTGFVVGAGLDVHALVIHIVPEFRYTRWSADQIAETNGLIRSNRNQTEFLVGITF
jgi:hypothetical protein